MSKSNEIRPINRSLLCATALSSCFWSPTVSAQVEQTEDVVVATATNIPDTKRVTSEITSVLDTGAFETTGAGDIASALTRVTGLSLSQGKFVVVRGLNERYSSATLNGSPLPSPEPLRRVAPLDLFPTSVLSGVVVSKTYSPEFSGEFGGGAINMTTKGLPAEAFFEISASTSYNSETTFKDGLVYDGSESDWTGFGGSLRDLPQLDADGVPRENFESFSTLVVDQNDSLPLNGSLRLSGGNRWDLENGMSIGVLATAGYENSWETREGEDNTANIGANNSLVILDQGRRRSTENQISLNGLLGIGIEFNENHNVQFIGLATRQSSAEARVLTGVDREDRIFRQDFTEWFEREVYMGQLLGEHYFSGLNDAEVNWRLAYAEAGRDAPYERRVNYEDFEDGNGFRFQFNRPGTNNDIRFSELDDTTFDAGLDFVFPVSLGTMETEFKIGGSYLDKSRDSQQTDFRYFGSLPEELRFSRIDTIFSDAVVDAGILEIRRGGTTGFPDVSEAALDVLGAYAAIEVEVNPKLRLSGGLRFEASTQETAIAQATIADSRFQFEDLAENFILPAATLTYTFADNLQLRLAASKTINRPQFRELTPSIFVNTDTDDRFVGNPFLKNSESNNFDARVEYYFGRKQFVTLGGFYKDFTDPIEEFIFNGLGESNATSFLNAPSAELFGVEAEFEKVIPFDKLGLKSDKFASKEFIIRANYTYTDSSVSANGDVSITPPSVNPAQGVSPLVLSAEGLYGDGRKLQGQSDHLANLQLGIEDYDANWEATFLMNYSSDRIRAVEDRSNGLPSIIESLPLTVDFVFNKAFAVRGGDYRVGFKVQNIFNDGYEASQSLGDTKIVVDSYDPGTTVSVNLKREF
ncbi:TonB-dependent receptor domain-containing protein [Litorimonas cladophorae]|uniref:TonB-dependent receptor domain-containing protein n=1 Tax=Litorimonas cladophorae TaxID=1220491 RepID=UPI00167BBAD3|nr:TonB-dependent receptor [Litorimonas cladophorae]